MANFFYSKGDQPFGPVTARQLKQLAAEGNLLPPDFVWREGGTEKVLAANVRGLVFKGSADAELIPPPLPQLAEQPTPPPLSKAEVVPQHQTAPIPPIQRQPVQPSPSDAFTQMAATTRGMVGGLFNKVAEASASLSQKPGPSLAASVSSKLTQATFRTTGGTRAVQQPPTTASTPVPPPQLPAGVSPQDVLFEVNVFYTGGHPELIQRANGKLLLTTSAIYFLPSAHDQAVRMPYSCIGTVLEPKTGSFPAEMLKRAETTKTGGTLREVRRWPCWQHDRRNWWQGCACGRCNCGRFCPRRQQLRASAKEPTCRCACERGGSPQCAV